MDFVAVPTIERGHDRHHSSLYGRHITLRVDGQKLVFSEARIALINTPKGTAVANKMFGRRDNTSLLHSLDHAT